MSDDPRPVLGFDMHNVPIRIGDRVRASGDMIRPEFAGIVFTVVGIDENARRATQIAPNLAPFISLYCGTHTRDCFVRAASVERLEPDSRVVSSWTTVYAITGWKPKEVSDDSRH